MPVKKTKYFSQKVRLIDGDTDHVFDSKLEGRRYVILKEKESQGLIENLQIQVHFEIIPATKMLRKSEYIADFVYDQIREYKGQQFKVRIVEDTKGVQQDVFRLKHKLMLWLFEREKLPWIFRISYDHECNRFEDTWVTDNPLIAKTEDLTDPSNFLYKSESGQLFSSGVEFSKAWNEYQHNLDGEIVFAKDMMKNGTKPRTKSNLNGTLIYKYR